MIQNITLDSYLINDEDGHKKYTCMDTNEFYYIFNEEATFDFSLITDTHTVDLPEFTEEYNNSNEKGKVEMNINKIVEALNMKDYGYVYSKFSEGFKKNYFETEDDFVEFAKLYFKNNNKVTGNSFSSESGTYIYNITLTDKTGVSTLELNTDILMRLGEGTDFVFTMSGISPDIVYNGF